MDAPSTLNPPPPPLLWQLAGHPLRWRLLGELAQSDRAVSELMALVGEPQNLVSYHLGKLRDAGLVAGHRSDADRRDTYYGLDLARLGDMLSLAGEALHPGLRLAPAPRAPIPRARVLFLCSGNSARSQMAEALVRARSGGAVDAHSAGSSPKPLHPNAVRAMREAFGLDLTGQAPKSLSIYADQAFDWVISLCDRVREVCPEFPGEPRAIHWSLANPAADEPDDVSYPRFQDTAARLSDRIDFLLARLAEPGARQPDVDTGSGGRRAPNV